MYDQPSTSELIQAVKDFVDKTAIPELSGRSAFHARVASNVLDMILRDIELRADNDAEERARLQSLLSMPDVSDLQALNKALSQKIHDGSLDLGSVELMDHLKMTAISQIKVDQPNYSGLKEALKEL